MRGRLNITNVLQEGMGFRVRLSFVRNAVFFLFFWDIVSAPTGHFFQAESVSLQASDRRGGALDGHDSMRQSQ